MSADPRPVLLVTGHAPPDRIAAFAALDDREGLAVALFGGRRAHGVGTGPAAGAPPVPHLHVAPRAVHALAASGRFRAVVAGIGGRVALPAAALGARRGGVPLVLWTSLWAHPRSLAHALSWLPTRALYARADAVVAYGPHVAAYVRARGARRVHVAPQAVDPAFWGAPIAAPRRAAPFQAAFVGRDAPEKGLDVLLAAWAVAGLGVPDAALALAGPDPADRPGALGPLVPHDVRALLAGSDVLVVPSRRTATFREPWGLVANEAMHRGLPVVATTEVGAVAGGLVEHEVTGLVVPPDDPPALAAALCRLRGDAPLRARLGAAARRRASAYTPQAWAAGVSAALADVGAARRPR